MESELAKTLRSMSDDHRMVPDFSEQLLDIADTIERQAKEIASLYRQRAKLQGDFDARQQEIDKRRDNSEQARLWVIELEQERDEALKQFAVDAAQAQNQIDAAAAKRVQIKDLQGRLWSVRESRDHARKQRDAALAENKKLNGVIGGLSAQSQDEIDRLTVTANNNAAAHAKACEDLAQARAEVERLKGEVDLLGEQSAQRAEDQAIYDAGISDGLTRSRRDWS